MICIRFNFCVSSTDGIELNSYEWGGFEGKETETFQNELVQNETLVMNGTAMNVYQPNY